MKEELIKRVEDFRNNAIFPSKESDGVEHVDMSYVEVMQLCDAILSHLKS